MKRYVIFSTSLLIFVIVIIGMAQTEDQFSQKYGPKDARGRYTIRPDVGFEAKYKNRVLSEVNIESLKDNGEGPKYVMRTALALEALNELAPKEKRGKAINKGSEGAVEFSCTSVTQDKYEVVDITTTKRCVEQGGGIYSINIHWKPLWYR